MKKNYLWSLALASLFMTACSQDDIIKNDNGNGDGSNSYLSVRLMSADTSLTRAEGNYEDGTETENKITKVRFYFFTETGAPANVKLNGSTYVNYYDWTPDEGDQVGNPPTNDNVESKLKQATIVINTSAGDKLPRQMVAVLNPTETTVPSRSLSELKIVVNDYAKPTLTTKGKFVMFNSVYADDNKQNEICAVPISESNLAKTEELAKANPVNIYVERNVAKVTVTLGDEIGFSNDGMLKLKDAEDNDLTVGGTQVYLKINGWKLTAETDKGRLGKKINLAWEQTWWNIPSMQRSCWAINASTAQNRYCTYNDITGSPTSLYTNENAEDYTDLSGNTTNLNRTKVILSGTLGYLDEGGEFKEFTIVRHLGAHFADKFSGTETENLTKLKENILSQLAANGYHYYFQEGDTRKGIGVNDLKIVIVDQDAQENSPANDCYVYAQLSDDAKAKTWYDSTDENATAIANTAIDAALKNNVDKALVWKNGMTYYYYEIVHNGIGESSTKGVVRNHVYKTKVTKIVGLGTPVYDPTQIIYPEKPKPNDHYIAAQINILSWHIVSNDYQLEW